MDIHARLGTGKAWLNCGTAGFEQHAIQWIALYNEDLTERKKALVLHIISNPRYFISARISTLIKAFK